VREKLAGLQRQVAELSESVRTPTSRIRRCESRSGLPAALRNQAEFERTCGVEADFAAEPPSAHCLPAGSGW
jgi:hypothetical protein